MKHSSLDVSLESTSGQFPHDPTLGGLSHYDCLVFRNFFVLADRVLFWDLLDSEFCLAVDDSLSFLEDYFGRRLHNDEWHQMPGIFACVYAHSDHMVLNLGFLLCGFLLFLREKSSFPFRPLGGWSLHR